MGSTLVFMFRNRSFCRLTPAFRYQIFRIDLYAAQEAFQTLLLIFHVCAVRIPRKYRSPTDEVRHTLGIAAPRCKQALGIHSVFFCHLLHATNPRLILINPDRLLIFPKNHLIAASFCLLLQALQNRSAGDVAALPYIEIDEDTAAFLPQECGDDGQIALFAEAAVCFPEPELALIGSFREIFLNCPGEFKSIFPGYRFTKQIDGIPAQLR